MSGRKVELFENPALFQQPPWPQHLNMVTCDCFSSKNGDFCKKLSQKILCTILTWFFNVNSVQKFTQKNNHWPHLDQSSWLPNQNNHISLLAIWRPLYSMHIFTSQTQFHAIYTPNFIQIMVYKPFPIYYWEWNCSYPEHLHNV